jgi:hypothetical protein
MLFDLSKRAMLTGNYSELDEAIRSKIRPYLYNNGDGTWIHCAHLACLRNREEGQKRATCVFDLKLPGGWDFGVLKMFREKK